MDDLLTTQDVARLAGTGPTAVKRWADAGLLRCVRTGGGHRRFPREDVERFLRAAASPAAEAAAAGSPGREPWVGALLEGGDPRALEALLLSERARLGAWHGVARTIGQALASLGTLWRSGAVTILEEHLASERLARALARLQEAMPLAPDAPRALLACAEGDDHELGLALAELVLREAGFATLWTGRRTPRAEVEALVRRGAVTLLAVSASEVSTDPHALRAEADALGTTCRAAGVALALGGRGAWPERPRHGRRFHEFAAFHAWATELARRAGSAAATPPSAT